MTQAAPDGKSFSATTAACASAAFFETVYRDEFLFVLDKPPGLLAVPGRGPDKQDCLSARVQARHPEALVVHRLDMATSGLMLMARNPCIQSRLGKAFAQREVYKRYVAVVNGILPMPADRSPSTNSEDWELIDLPIALDWVQRPLRVIDQQNGKPSQTRWRAVEHNRLALTTRVLLEPLTGRSHQLRIHMHALGYGIVGDTLYAGATPTVTPRRLLLHAAELRFRHPATGIDVAFASAPSF